MSARVLLKQIAGQTVPEKNISFAPMVVRNSCGCSDSLPSEPLVVIRHSQDWSTTLREQQPAIIVSACASLAYIRAARVEAWVLSWLEAIRSDLTCGAGREFLGSLEQAQREGFELGVEVASWHRCVAIFLHQVRCCMADPRLQTLLDQIEARAYLRLGVTMELLENARQTEIEFRDLALREISESLMTTFDLTGILDVLSSELARFYVSACYISLFEDPQNPADLSRLIYAWRNGNRIEIAPAGIVFPSKDLVPNELRAVLTSSELIVEALYSKEDRLGFMLIEVEPRYISVTNALRALVSGALQSVLLLEQRRKAEEKLLQSQAQLQALVEKLEYTNKELESFAYSVSHDLRSPLRSILGFSSILEREHRLALDDDARQLLDRITQNTKRMGILIDDLLAFSRVGRQQIQIKPVDMNQIVRELVDEIKPETGEPTVEWVLGDLSPGFADPALIRQVWVNLINNAVKYSSKNSQARVEISSDHNDDEVVYHVFDNGAGFDMRYADKLFGVFQRLHRDEEFSGTGIGLAIVHRILLRHGGRIWAQSDVGKGAAFHFSLPQSFNS